MEQQVTSASDYLPSAWPGLYDASKAARKSDPVTSKLAAAKAGQTARTHASLILECLRNGDKDAEQVGAELGLQAHEVRRRFADLERAGLSKPTDKTTKTVYGRLQRVWMAV